MKRAFLLLEVSFLAMATMECLGLNKMIVTGRLWIR